MCSVGNTVPDGSVTASSCGAVKSATPPAPGSMIVPFAPPCARYALVETHAASLPLHTAHPRSSPLRMAYVR
jgi:hypothetical protein